MGLLVSQTISHLLQDAPKKGPIFPRKQAGKLVMAAA
jgi:hypothetical protein